MDSANDEVFEKTFTICRSIEFILKLNEKNDIHVDIKYNILYH